MAPHWLLLSSWAAGPKQSRLQQQGETALVRCLAAPQESRRTNKYKRNQTSIDFVRVKYFTQIFVDHIIYHNRMLQGAAFRFAHITFRPIRPEAVTSKRLAIASRDGYPSKTNLPTTGSSLRILVGQVLGFWSTSNNIKRYHIQNKTLHSITQSRFALAAWKAVPSEASFKTQLFNSLLRHSFEQLIGDKFEGAIDIKKTSCLPYRAYFKGGWIHQCRDCSFHFNSSPYGPNGSVLLVCLLGVSLNIF